MSSGTFYAVGVGPGSADLLTVQALQVLEACELVCFPETAKEAASVLSPASHHLAYDAVSGAVNLAEKQLLFCPMPMSLDPTRAREAYEATAALCEEPLSCGKDVAFVSIGDVSLYSTAAHLARVIASRGHPIAFVAGVTSVSAAACACALALAGKESAVTLLPADAYYRRGALTAALRAAGTKVLLKAGRHLADILSLIASEGLLSQTYLVQNVTLPTERRYSGEALLKLPDDVFLHSYLSVIIVLECSHE